MCIDFFTHSNQIRRFFRPGEKDRMDGAMFLVYNTAAAASGYCSQKWLDWSVGRMGGFYDAVNLSDQGYKGRKTYVSEGAGSS